MKNKAWAIILFLVQAIPLPFSLVSWIGTLISVGGIGTIYHTNIFEIVGAMLMLAYFVFVGSYPLTYIIAAVNTKKAGRLCFWSFAPMLHVTIAGLVFVFF